MRGCGSLLLVLVALLAWLQYRLWFGEGGSARGRRAAAAGAAADARERGPEAAQRRAGRRSRGPEVGRGGGRGARAQRARHDQARARRSTAWSNRTGAAPMPTTRRQQTEPDAMTWAVCPPPAAARASAARCPSSTSSVAGKPLIAHTLRRAARASGGRRAPWSCCRPTMRTGPAGRDIARQAGADLRRRRRARRFGAGGTGTRCRPTSAPTISCWCTTPRVRTCAATTSTRCSSAAATTRSARSWPRRCATRSSAPATTARIDAHRAARAPVARTDAAAVPPRCS